MIYYNPELNKIVLLHNNGIIETDTFYTYLDVDIAKDVLKVVKFKKIGKL